MNLVILGDFTCRNVGHNVLLRALLHQLGRLEPGRIGEFLTSTASVTARPLSPSSPSMRSAW